MSSNKLMHSHVLRLNPLKIHTVGADTSLWKLPSCLTVLNRVTWMDFAVPPNHALRMWLETNHIRSMPNKFLCDPLTFVYVRFHHLYLLIFMHLFNSWSFLPYFNLTHLLLTSSLTSCIEVRAVTHEKLHKYTHVVLTHIVSRLDMSPSHLWTADEPAKQQQQLVTS